MGFFKRLGEPPSEEQLRAQEVRTQVGAVAGVEQIAICRPRSRAKVCGIVQSIKVLPREATTTLEVQIYDGTDEITGIWYGRRKIPGIELGKCLVLEGTIGKIRGSTALQIINPAYELVGEEG